jgi:hypothetical protein
VFRVWTKSGERYGNGGCVPSPADVLEPATISGSLDEDLRKAATRSAEVVGVSVAAVLPITTATLSRSD